MLRRSIIFAGGGTGGHIHPGLAIAEHIADRDPSARMIFVCSDREIDRTILDRSGRRWRPIPARPFGVKPGAILRLARTWGGCVRAGRDLIRAERAVGAEPVVVTTGGFVGPPLARAARAERAPVILVNLDARPGRATLWIGRRADAAFSMYTIPTRPAWEVVTPIVRKSALPHGEPGECRRRLGLAPDRPTLAVLGGSQGAGTINQAMIALAQRRSAALSPWQIVHQSGARDRDRVARGYADAGVAAVVEPYFDPIGPVWGAADLVLARSGAGTVAEARASGTPAVFLPYPFHRDDHQRHNSAPLEAAGAAVVITDKVIADATAAVLIEALTPLAPGAPQLSAMTTAARRRGEADGAAVLADRLLR